MTLHAPSHQAQRLCLRDMGSFHTAGLTVTLSGLPKRELLLAAGGVPVVSDPNGDYVVEQMYAQYFLPDPASGRPPLLFWHGGGMTAKVWETTPDGRPGWLNYFLHRGWDCYLCDAVERGRSGFAPVPQVWPEAPVSQAAADIYSRFRIGNGRESYSPDPARRSPYPSSQFPPEAVDGLLRQMVPRWTQTDDAIVAGYTQLLERVGPSILVSHSQGGVFALKLAHARPDLVRAVVAIEPAAVPVIDESARRYATPTLIVMGDNIDLDARWPRMQARLRAFHEAHDSTEWLSLPEAGIAGNTHVMMMDANHYQIADLVQEWLARTCAA